MVCEFLMQCPVFTRLTPRTLTEVADQMAAERHPAGAVIVRQGDPGDKFYVIKAGTVEVIVEDAGKRRTVAALGPGNFFGEAALLTGAPRNATVIAKEDLEVHTLAKEQFQAVIQASASFGEEVRKALFERQ
jgi:putative ABC transport system ATP-binding protein